MAKYSMPVLDNIRIPYSLISDNFDDASNFIRTIKYSFKELNRSLQLISGDSTIRFTNCSKSLKLSSDEVLNRNLYLCIEDVYTSLLSYLSDTDDSLQINISDDQSQLDDVIREEIDLFKKITSFESLKENYGFLYERTVESTRKEIEMYYKKLKRKGISKEQLIDANNRRALIKNLRYGKKNSSFADMIKDYPKIEKMEKRINNIDIFTEDYSKFFEEVLNNINSLKNQINNYSDLKICVSDEEKKKMMNEEEILKFNLLVAVAVLKNYIDEGYKDDDSKLQYVKDFLDKNSDMYTDDVKIRIRDMFVWDDEKNNFVIGTTNTSEEYSDFTFADLAKLYAEISEKNHYLFLNYSTMSKDDILETTNKLYQIGINEGKYQASSNDEVEKEYNEIIQSISNSLDVSDSDNLSIKTLESKIEFFLTHKPLHVIKGEDTFEKYFGFVYPNGYIVLDYFPPKSKKHKETHYNIKTVYGKGLYLMKLDDYNDLKSYTLSNIQKSPKCKRNNHSKNWQDNLYRLLTSYENLIEVIIPKEMKQIDMITTIKELREYRKNAGLTDEKTDQRLDKKETELVDSSIEKATTIDQLHKLRKDWDPTTEEMENKIALKERKLKNEQVMSQLHALNTDINAENDELEEKNKRKKAKLLETTIDILTDIPQLRKLENNADNLTEGTKKKLEEKKKEIIQKRMTIDNEIKSQQDETAIKVDYDDLEDDETELLSAAKGYEDFTSLYETLKRITSKSKRNAAVSLRTKLRTRDAHGYLHCDFCDFTNKSVSMFQAHHLIPISEGGIDNLYNTVCLCPNCHTRIHKYLKLRKKLDSGIKDDLLESTMGEFVLPSEYDQLLYAVKNRLLNDTPEYLHNFEELFTQNHPLLDINLLDKNVNNSELKAKKII